MAFVGRERELDRLSRILSRTVTGAGRTIFIEGPAGVGKTTLTAALIKRALADRPGIAVGRGRCVQAFESGEPYLPFVDALRDLSDESTAGFVNRSTLGVFIKELAPYWLSVVPLVGNILSATFATAAEVQGRFRKVGAPSREALFVQYFELISRVAKQTPLILFLDDLHWADHASLALLSYLSRGTANLPVVIIGTLRHLRADHDDPALSQTILELEREGLADRVTLGELDERSLDELLDAVFEGDSTERLTRWIFRTAGGNPLFATELARLLISTGGAVNVDGEWQLTEVAEQTEVPRTAEAVIEKRLQRLGADELNLLQYASVDGDEFDSAVLARLLDRDELEVLDALQPLERQHGLVECVGDITLPDGDAATSYRFSHALVQTVLYRQVLGKRRILLHRKAGDVLETLWGDSADRVAGRLARHFHEGRQADRAYRYARIAADAAAAVFANWEAIDFLLIARRNAKDPPSNRWVGERLGDVYLTVGHYADGIASLRDALPLADTEIARLRIERKIVTLERMAALTPSPELAARLSSTLHRLTDEPIERCRVLIELTRLTVGAELVDYAGEAVRVAETVVDPMLLADALERLAVAQIFVVGSINDAFPVLERALRIAASINDPVLLTRYYNIMGVAHAKLGRYRDALGDFEEALSECERMGDPNGIGAACTNLGFLMLRFGLYDEAERMLDRARTIHERRDRASVVESLFGLAERARLANVLDLAVERYERLLQHARQFQLWNPEIVALAGIGLCRLQQGHLDDARVQAARANAVLSKSGDGRWFEDRDMLELLLARLEVADGFTSAAAQRLAGAAAELEARDVFLWARMELERARVLQKDDPTLAAALIDEVAAATASVQSPPIEHETSALRAQTAA